MYVFLLHVIGYDVWFYISHLLLHTKYLYKYHKLHHNAKYPVYYDALIASNEENIFQFLGFFTPYLFYQFCIYQMLAGLAFISIRGMMRHDNRFIFLIGNHHLIHHETFNYNFGEYWIDYLFNTHHPDANKKIYGYLYY